MAGKYLENYCNTSLTWVKTGGIEGARAACGQRLAPVARPVQWIKRARWTYYQNVVDSSYSFAWWGWERWQTELDWMALHGVNLALMYTGQEKVLVQLYQRFGVNLLDATGVDAFFNGPGFLSWSRGQGQADVGGFDQFVPNASGALPPWWLEQQAALGKQIMQRMAELGITAILRGFEGETAARCLEYGVCVHACNNSKMTSNPVWSVCKGNVPLSLIKKFPSANITKAGLLDALDPLFAKLSDAYMRLLIDE